MNFEEVKNIIVDTLGCDADKVTAEASLTEDLEADSLDLVELHMALEDAIGTKIPDEEIAKLETVGKVVEYLKAHKEAAKA
ncbi:acyl carrier protein [Butyrivibrio sp. NC3005]|uniref:acyl carrier protein n=1 Tax=Butyrivibrio sp. NC3005 TaxID=1280685 RepID=UPI00041A9C9A|nr:acyl carrier protein [Butyrivibrio sp. NC3005]